MRFLTKPEKTRDPTASSRIWTTSYLALPHHFSQKAKEKKAIIIIMAGVLVVLGIFILSIYYIVLAFSKGRKRDQSCTDCVTAKSETLRSESSRSKTFRKKFSIPDKDGKVAISIDRVRG